MRARRKTWPLKATAMALFRYGNDTIAASHLVGRK
jgi:hypothetical protein